MIEVKSITAPEEVRSFDGGRVEIVWVGGTTVVRALETVTDETGRVHPGQGWTELVVTPEHGVRAVDGLITGWHEPEASHLELIAAMYPRPVCVEFAERDGTTTPEWHARAWAEVEKLAHAWNMDDKIVRDHFDGVHEVHQVVVGAFEIRGNHHHAQGV